MHKIRLLKSSLVIVLMLLFVQNVAGSVSITLEPTKIPIGGHARLSFEVQYPAGATLQMPVFNEKIHEKIEILHYGSNDTIRDQAANQIKIRRTLRITSWDEGFHAIAPITFFVLENSDTLLLETEPILLEVEPFSIEEHTDLKDIKSIKQVPITLAELKYYILGVIVLIILAWLIYRYLQNRKKSPPPASVWEKPDVPAHIAALGSLEKLKAMKLWQQGKVKQYHIELTNIIRKYLHKRFGANAMEMTTAEIMQAMQGKQEMIEHGETLRYILELADLAKFAKHQPTAGENEGSMDLAFEFVNVTKILVSEANPKSKNTQEEE